MKTLFSWFTSDVYFDVARLWSHCNEGRGAVLREHSSRLAGRLTQRLLAAKLIQNQKSKIKQIKQTKLKSNQICRVTQSPPDWLAGSHRGCWLQHWFKIKNQRNQTKKLKSNKILRGHTESSHTEVGRGGNFLLAATLIQNQKSNNNKKIIK